MTAEREFETELEIFRKEAEAGTQFFYAHLAMHAAAADHPEIYDLLNKSPLFWNTVAGALQTAVLITLGRVFDQGSAHNLDKVLRVAQDNPDIFTKGALARRKCGTKQEKPAWLDEYLKGAYEPTVSDFRRIRAHIRKRRRIYESNYRDIRHKWFAHREVSELGAAALFGKANIRELQQLFVFLNSLYGALWQLYFNGLRPVLRPQRYSVRRIRNAPSPAGHRGAVQEKITLETEEVLLAASRTLRDSQE